VHFKIKIKIYLDLTAGPSVEDVTLPAGPFSVSTLKIWMKFSNLDETCMNIITKK